MPAWSLGVVGALGCVGSLSLSPSFGWLPGLVLGPPSALMLAWLFASAFIGVGSGPQDCGSGELSVGIEP